MHNLEKLEFFYHSPNNRMRITTNSKVIICFFSICYWILGSSAFKTTFTFSKLKSTPTTTMMSLNNKRITIPEKVIVGYANWNQCDETIVHAVEQGVNVVIWFSINLAIDSSGNPVITGGPDMDCVATQIQTIANKQLDTIHLISIGGWNSPHPNTINTPEVMYKAWDHWNREIAARPEKGFYGFHGFDWDIEGNDTPSNPENHITVACLDLMGKMSQFAKQDEYIVTMAPAESYVDPYRNGFDRSLLHEYNEWKNTIPTFAYHGLNAYTYLLSRYGTYIPITKNVSLETSTVELPTFDFITIQLYEGYSHAEYNITQLSKSPEQVISDLIQRLVKGWNINFQQDPELQYPFQEKIQIPSQRIVIGLANGWAGDGKFLLLYPDEVQRVYEMLKLQKLTPRGFAFWNILDEGKCSLLRPDEPVWLASGLNDFLKIR